MKKKYMKPELGVIRLRPQSLVCSSPYDAIGPGQPNKPAGARGFDDWDDDWDDERDNGRRYKGEDDWDE